MKTNHSDAIRPLPKNVFKMNLSAISGSTSFFERKTPSKEHLERCGVIMQNFVCPVKEEVRGSRVLHDRFVYEKNIN